MKYMVPFLFVFSCWSGAPTEVVKYEYIYRRTKVVNSISCRLCGEGEDPKNCLTRMPEYRYDMSDDERDEAREALISWTEYAAYCLGVVYQETRWLIYE